MVTLDQDIKRLNEVTKGTCSENWCKIFSRSNENLNKLLQYLDVSNKEIYSVLSSSDMLFELLLNDAKSVETFDINPLTYRYYFLRKWLLVRNLIDANGLKLKEINGNCWYNNPELNFDNVNVYGNISYNSKKLEHKKTNLRTIIVETIRNIFDK